MELTFQMELTFKMEKVMAGQPNAQADNQGEFRDELGSMQEAFPALAEGLSGYLSALDGLPGIDRKTHELIRLACNLARSTRHDGADPTELWAGTSTRNVALCARGVRRGPASDFRGVK